MCFSLACNVCGEVHFEKQINGVDHKISELPITLVVAVVISIIVTVVVCVTV
jgi:hypothetical protein